MVSRNNHEMKLPREGEVTVYGRLDRPCVDAIDRMADQMLMPRSWVVTQILQEWYERRQLNATECERSWNDSIREALGQRDPEEIEPPRAIPA